MVIASANGTGGAVSVSQVVLSPTDAPVAAGLQYAYQYVVTGAPTGGTFRNIILPVEGVRTFAGKTVRLTFWAHADATRAVGLSIITFPGTGGSPSGGVGISGGIMTVAATTTWQQFTTTFVMPAASTLTPGTNADGSIRVFFSLPLNTTMAIALAGVQLEIDTGAVTPFENRPPAVEMALCQRYFQSLGWAIFGYNTAGSVVSVCVGFNAAMRTLPTLVGTTNSTSNASATTFNTLGVTGCQPFVTATATGSVGAFGTLTASAEL
jgi:hypothetical protein